MSDDAIVSELIHDPQMAELLVEFGESLNDTVARLNHALERGDRVAVCRIGHQMKGAGGGYGFPVLSEVGAKLETACEKEWHSSNLIRMIAHEFQHLCERAQRGCANTAGYASLSKSI